MGKGKSIQSAMNELEEAHNQYDSAHSDSRAANLRETEALNRLNNAQKKFDAAVDAIKKDAPCRSDWRNKRVTAER